MSAEERYHLAINRVAKWRNLFAGWHFPGNNVFHDSRHGVTP